MLRSKLEHKVLLIIIIALICGLGLSVVISIKRESANLADQYRVRSLLFGDTLMTGFRNVMLSGRAGYVKQLIAEARAEFRDYGQLLLFDNMGKQILPSTVPFLPGQPPNPASLPSSSPSRAKPSAIPASVCCSTQRGARSATALPSRSAVSPGSRLKKKIRPPHP